VAAIQVDYSLFYREIEATSGTAEANILSTAREFGVAIVCATPLGGGLLSSTFKDYMPISDGTDFRAAVPSFQSENAKHNTAMVQKVHEFAEKKGCSIPQLGLAWLLKQGDDIFPIPGTKRLVNLEQNFEALDVELNDEEELEIRRYAESVQFAGGNVPDSAQSWVYVDTVEPKV
jgi:aryl-alcohol dehydrogenase-like predicted oxidoreductase